MGNQQFEFEISRSNPVGEAQDGTVSEQRSASRQASSEGASVNVMSDSESLRSVLRSVKSEAEKNAISLALQKTGWNRKAAARLLKVSYRTVLYKIEHYNMIPSDSYPLHKLNESDPARQDSASVNRREGN